MSAIKFPVNVQSYQDLFDAAAPDSAFMPEAVPNVIYDTQSFDDNWSSISFFAETNPDKTMSNIQQANTMPGEQYFVLYSVTFDFLAGPANISTTPDQYNDLREILDVARATLTMQIADKDIFKIPLRVCHSAGAVWAAFQGTPATNGIVNAAFNAPASGQFWTDGAIILPPKQTFTMTLTGVPSQMVTARLGQLAMHGALYRPVR